MSRQRDTTRFPLPYNDVAWICDECGEPIADDGGWLTVDVRAAIARSRKLDDFRPSAATLDDIVTLGQAAPWSALHAACDPGDMGGYWIAIDRLRTAAQILDWSAHLAGKRWASGTDWWRVVREVALRQLDVNA